MYYTPDQVLNTLRITVPKINWILSGHNITATYWNGESTNIYGLLSYSSMRRFALKTFDSALLISVLRDAITLAKFWNAM